jgi:hypothetical protein
MKSIVLEEKANNIIFIDAHVHIYDCFHLPVFFNSAVDNFKIAYTNAGISNDQGSCVLLLSESEGINYYQKLCMLADSLQTLSCRNDLSWSFRRTLEHSALKAHRSDGQEIYVLAGRQIITAAKIEVLALMTSASFVEKQSLSQTIEAVRRAGGIPVVPWGFGKWVGKRGSILKQFLMENDEPIFLGDNGGRPVFWPRPKLFSLVESKGGRVLPGSDPLPMEAEVARVGSFGFAFNTRLSSHPVRDLKLCLEDPTTIFWGYGASEKAMRFLKNQFLIRLARHY